MVYLVSVGSWPRAVAKARGGRDCGWRHECETKLGCAAAGSHILLLHGGTIRDVRGGKKGGRGAGDDVRSRSSRDWMWKTGRLDAPRQRQARNVGAPLVGELCSSLNHPSPSWLALEPGENKTNLWLVSASRSDRALLACEVCLGRRDSYQNLQNTKFHDT